MEANDIRRLREEALWYGLRVRKRQDRFSLIDERTGVVKYDNLTLEQAEGALQNLGHDEWLKSAQRAPIAIRDEIAIEQLRTVIQLVEDGVSDALRAKLLQIMAILSDSA